MMLKVVKLLKLYVENFRGIKNFVLTPDGRSATVQGGNGTGKSTLMAAFLWLLTGKDAQGRENYNVFPLGTDGNRLSGCSPTVTATLSMPDGHTLILQRSICERWTKRRGSAETEYNGDETRYFIDEVPVSAGEYSSAIFGVFPEKLLPLLLNAVWFSEQTKDYKERRRLLLEQFGSLQPADVFTANPELSDLESMLGTHSVDEFSRICTERRKRYKDSLSALPARIDENRKQLHPVSDARAVKNERSKLNVEIAKLQYEIEHTTADAVQRHGVSGPSAVRSSHGDQYRFCGALFRTFQMDPRTKPDTPIPNRHRWIPCRARQHIKRWCYRYCRRKHRRISITNSTDFRGGITMADTAAAINLANGLKADRKLEMIFVNMGTGETEEWELLGRGVEDASVAFNHDTNQTTDILGITDTEVSPAKPELDLDPCTIRGGQKLSAKLLDIERRNAIAELGQFTILHVHCFLGTASAFTAEKHTNCTIVPQSLGGSTYVGMPMNVYLSNEKVLGTATVANGVPTFTPTTAA